MNGATANGDIKHEKVKKSDSDSSALVERKYSPPVRVLTIQAPPKSPRIPFMSLVEARTCNGFFERDGPHNRTPALAALGGKGAVSIRISDIKQLQLAVKSAIKSRDNGKTTFDTVQFYIWEDTLFHDSKNILLLADFRAGFGFVIREWFAEGQEICHVTLPPDGYSSALGLIKHISGATLFQIDKENKGKFPVHCIGAAPNGKFCISVVRNACMSLAKTTGFAADDRVFQLKKDGVSTAIIKRKRSKFSNSQAVLVQFREYQMDIMEVRCLAVGFALILILTESYPILSDLLRDSSKFTPEDSTTIRTYSLPGF